MKTKDIKDLQTKTFEELKKLLKDAQAALVTLKLDHQQNKLKDTRSIFMTRKQIAVLKTIMHNKPLVASTAVAKTAESKKSKTDKGGKE